jgi:hypothetical protein
MLHTTEGQLSQLPLFRSSRLGRLQLVNSSEFAKLKWLQQ